MRPTILHEKNKTALGQLGLWWLKNFGSGYCGDLSVFTSLLVDQGEFHPRQVQQVLYAKANRERVKKILERGRQLVVGGVTSEGFLFDETDEMMESEVENLPDLDSWIRGVLKGESLDVRGVHLLAKRFRVLVQILQQMVEGDSYMLRDVDGFSTPLRENGRRLWTSGCHFEAVVTMVSAEMFNLIDWPITSCRPPCLRNSEYLAS